MGDLPPPLLSPGDGLSPLSTPTQSPSESNENLYTIDYEIDFTKFLNVAKSMRLFPKDPLHEYQTEFQRLKAAIRPKLHEYLSEKKVAKLHLAIFANFYKIDKNNPDNDILETKSFHLDTKSRLFFEDESAQPKLDEIFQELARRIEEKLYLSSNYVYNHLLHCDVIFLDYQPIIGSSYIPLCPKLKYRKNCLLNIKNTNDNECLLLCIAASLFADKIDKKLRKRDNCNPKLYRPYLEKINVGGKPLKYDYGNSDIDWIEKCNLHLSINVFIFDEERNTILPKRISDRDVSKEDDNMFHPIDLLLIHDQDKKRFHYVLITNLSTLSKKYHSKSKKDLFVCRNCLSNFTKFDLYDFHTKICHKTGKNQGQLVELPPEGSIMEFTEGYKAILIPFLIFADFECYNQKTQVGTDTFQNNGRVIEGNQVPYAYAIKLSTSYPQYSMPTIVRYDFDGNLQNNFLLDLKDMTHKISEITKNVNFPLDWSVEQKIQHMQTRACQSCASVFHPKDNPSQIDHDHLLPKNNFRYSIVGLEKKYS